MNTLEKIDNFIKDSQDVEDGYIVDRIVDFIDITEPDSLTEEQTEIIGDILEELDYPDIDTVDEALGRLRKRISPQAKRERKKSYRRNKAKIKKAQKRYKRSAKGKKTKKVAKRMAKRGRTATGKRQTTRV